MHTVRKYSSQLHRRPRHRRRALLAGLRLAVPELVARMPESHAGDVVGPPRWRPPSWWRSGHTGLSAWESDRSSPVTPLTSRLCRPTASVTDRSSPWLIARQLHDDLFPMTAPAPCRGWPASGPGWLVASPWFLAGGGTEAPRSMVAAGHFRRKREAPLTVEGCRRTLSGPSPDLSPARTIASSPVAWLWIR